jgi:hypothetical protein
MVYLVLVRISRNRISLIKHNKLFCLTPVLVINIYKHLNFNYSNIFCKLDCSKSSSYLPKTTNEPVNRAKMLLYKKTPNLKLKTVIKFNVVKKCKIKGSLYCCFFRNPYYIFPNKY